MVHKDICLQSQNALCDIPGHMDRKVVFAHKACQLAVGSSILQSDLTGRSSRTDLLGHAGIKISSMSQRLRFEAVAARLRRIDPSCQTTGKGIPSDSNVVGAFAR